MSGGRTIGNAPSGEKASVDGTEKFPIDGNQYVLIQTLEDLYALLDGTNTPFTGAIEIDVDSATAFVVGDSGDVGDVFEVDTATPQVTAFKVLLAGDKIIFTQTDGNEYIDSLADGYLDLSATTAIRFNNSAADTDVVLGFTGTTNSGTMTWLEDEDQLRMDDTLKTVGGRVKNVTTVNAATYDLLITDEILHVTYTGTGAVTSLTLPTAQVIAGRTIVIKDAGGNSATNNITIDTEGSETIDGAATFVIEEDYSSVSLYCDGSDWYVI